MKTPCPQAGAEGCPWAERPGGCFADTDHIVAQKFRYMGLLVSKYIDTPDNKEQLCRWEHDNKDDYAVELPSEEFMLQAVHAAWRNGQLKLNRKQYDRLFRVEPTEAA